MTSHLDALAYLNGQPQVAGVIKVNPEDFIVRERLSFEPTGDGEHLFLYITKKSLNTQDVIQRLSKNFSVSIRDIGYAGMKDKHAVTSQWFSLPITQIPDYQKQVESFNCLENVGDITINKSVLNNKKLKRGVIQSNYFEIIISGLEGNIDGLIDRLDNLTTAGVPNYFTEQRFGIDDKNILRAKKILAGEMREKNRQKRGIYFSAARSYVFNLMLSEQIQENQWSHVSKGDTLMLQNTRSIFRAEEPLNALQQRLDTNDLDKALPMIGNGTDPDQYDSHALAQNRELIDGLSRAGLAQQFRRCRSLPENLAWRFCENNKSLTLEFSLPSGCYATAVLRELITQPVV